jgi:hypothetical protein
VDVSRSDRHPQESPRRPRLLALPFVVLCAVAYLSSAAHHTLVQHATCLEHGEVIHVGEADGHSQQQVVQASFTDERITRAAQAAPAAHEAEAHCAHTFLRREGLPPPAESLLTVERLASSDVAPILEQRQLEPVARLRLAPKSSPPLS